MTKLSVMPFADQVEVVIGKLNRSFHALPLSGGASLRDSTFENRYNQLLGSKFYSDVSVAQPFLDNLVSPESDLVYSERLAARLFGADATFFTTCGTTTSNFIALSALCDKPSPRVLADRSLHQSLHIKLREIGARVDYLPSHELNSDLGLNLTKPVDLKRMLRSAEQECDGYELVVLSGQSYEGVVNSIPAFLKQIVESGTSLRKVLVDEAWGAANVFNPLLAPHTATAAAQSDLVRAAGICLVSTQSTHKSLSALRQASMIHVVGDPNVAKRIRKYRYLTHTTSASSQILVSLDLARAQAQVEGPTMVERSVKLARSFQSSVADTPLSDVFEVVDLTKMCEAFSFVVADPTKVILRSKVMALSGADIRRELFEQHGFYISRTFADSVLLNFHIGIHEPDVAGLVEALKALAHDTPCNDLDTTASDFVISYPPGVPLVVPGEKLSTAVHDRVQSEKQCGARVFFI